MLLMFLFACTSGIDTAADTDVSPEDTPAPGEIIPFRAATFNIDWLSPRDSNAGDVVPRNDRDREMIRTLITDYDLSLVALQEIEGSTALRALDFADEWSWEVGSSGRSQNPALLYRNDRFSVVDAVEVDLPGASDSYRDPMVVSVDHSDGLAFVVVVVHMPSGDDTAASALRQQQGRELHTWLEQDLAAQVGEDRARNVVLMGDFNDTFEGINTQYPSLDVFSDDPNWRIATQQADGDSSINYSSIIDHVILSPDMALRWTGEASKTGVNVIYHDAIEPWSNYSGGYDDTQNISSHRPVTLSFNAGQLP